MRNDKGGAWGSNDIGMNTHFTSTNHESFEGFILEFG